MRTPAQKPRTRLKAGTRYPNQLRMLRVTAGQRLADLAAELDVSPQAIREAELHGTGLSRPKWYRLADIFNIDPRLLETPYTVPE